MVENNSGLGLITPIEPRGVSYFSFINKLPGHENVTEDDRVGFKAVDYMVDVLRKVPQFETYLKRFRGLTLGNEARLTDKDDPNYTRDLLWRVHSPRELFTSVLINSDDFVMRTGKFMQWGLELKKVSEKTEGDSETDKKAKERVSGLLEEESEYFSLDLFAAAV